ncbi:hypothetical protein [Clavibacter capsici]|uniref:hypothetical protein n=1 Tax=Clavibacter capsici TaxID=1874630 RepID=UPI0006B172AC|nr:hypothetical protein [Clavibacter capsici]ALD13129.1 hypothetical protein AES38_09535 [Clavibacter capsici]
MGESRCLICQHPDRADIEADMAGGKSNVAVAEHYGSFSRDAVRRHRDSHLSPSLKAVAAKRETAGAVKAIDRVEDLYTRASGILEAATADGQAGVSLAAVRELRGLVELLAKLTGELDERPQVQILNVSTSPEWGEIRGRLLGALTPYPDAAAAVARALQAEA